MGLLQATALGLAIISGTTRAVSISVPSAIPSDASPAISRSFLGLGIESWSFPNYTGSHDKPNTFSINLFSALSSRTGGLPIRVGGDTGDGVKYDPTQTSEPILFDDGTNHPPSNSFSHSTYGPPFLEGLSLVPDARWVFQIPLLRNNLSNAVDYMAATLKAMPKGTFQALEFGNEPTQYGKIAPAEFGSWGPHAYAKAYKNWTDTITEQVEDLPKNQPNYWAVSNVYKPPKTWTIPISFEDGLNSSASSIQAASQHNYQAPNVGVGPSVLSSNLMNHTYTANSLSYLSPIISYLNSNVTPAVPLVIGETAVGSCTTSPCPNTLQSSFGAAIWAVDYMLYAMTLGVEAINFEFVAASYNAAWRPVPIFDSKGQKLAPEVHGTFYAELFVADLINQTSGALKVKELSTGDKGITGYAAYDGNALNKVVLLNENVFLTTDTQPRGTTNVTLGGLGDAKTVKVQYLTGSAADQYENITWAGEKYTYESNGKPVKVVDDCVTLDVVGGSVSVPVKSSEVAMVSV